MRTVVCISPVSVLWRETSKEKCVAPFVFVIVVINGNDILSKLWIDIMLSDNDTRILCSGIACI